MNENKNDNIILKNPDELTWDEFLDLLEIEAEKDNAIAREKMKRVITEFREDDGAFWRVDDITTLRLFEYAGYTERDDLGRLYQNLRSMERFNEYKERARKRQIEEKERQKSLRKANMANSPLGKFGARVKKLLNPNEQPDSLENTTNDSNAGEER